MMIKVTWKAMAVEKKLENWMQIWREFPLNIFMMHLTNDTQAVAD